MLCSNIKTEMVKHEICLLTSALSAIGHAENTAEDRSGQRSASRDICGCFSIMHSFSITYAYTLYIAKTILWTTLWSQTLYVYLQPLCMMYLVK